MLARTYVIFCLSFAALFTPPTAPETKSTTTTSTSTTTTTTTTTTVKPEVKHMIQVDEYTFVRGHRVTWEEARQACKDLDKQLLNIETIEKWNELTPIIYDLGFDKPSNSKEIWANIGWVDCKENNSTGKPKYFWANGDSLYWESEQNKASWWLKNQPDHHQPKPPDGPHHECIHICSENLDKDPNVKWDMGLNDFLCSEKFEYVCEENDNNYPESTCN